MKHIRWQLLIALVGVVFLSVVLALLAFGANTIERPDVGGTYVEGIAGRPNAINPIFAQYNEVDRDLASLIFTGLTRADENGNLKPDLATKWSVAPNGLVYTFTLRSDAYWHDGERFTADDVLYTFRTLQDPGCRCPPDLMAFWRTVAISATDAATIRFQLTQPYAPFLDYTRMGILPAHLLKDVSPSELATQPFNRRPIGTGPFQVAELTANHILLDANPRYYDDPRPYLGRIQFKFYPDYETIFTGYTREDVEGIARVMPSYLGKARNQPNLTLYNARIGGYSFVLFNLSKAPFQDKNVRQALLYATDRQHIVNDVLQGQGIVAASPIEPGSWANNSIINPYPFDLEKAKAILDAAGWRDPGDGTRAKDRVPLAFTLTTSDDPTRVAIANDLAKTWQTIGVKVAVQSVPAALLAPNVLRPRVFDAVLYEWRTLANDPDQYENWHETQIPDASHGGQNYSGLKDRDISETLEAARRTSDQAKRAELYRKFQELFADRVPALLLYYPVYTYGVDARVHGVQLAPMLTPSDRFRSVTQWYLKTKRVLANAPDEPTRTRPAPPPTATATPTLPPTPAPPTLPPPTIPPATIAPPTVAPTIAATLTPITPGTTLTPTTPVTATQVIIVVVATPAPSTTPAGQCGGLNGVIKAPIAGATVAGLVEIRGTANAPSFGYWKLEYRADANPNYTQLFRSDRPANDQVLSLWSTRTVANGAYWLQLSVVDSTGNFSSPCQIRVNVAN
ncbi:MAG: peptide ABC transporter substrate-binding protein [Chloroflexi bacterium]|nr:peptide ABC transporter substrate-binding protein [Chloroflexota bacterium]